MSDRNTINFRNAQYNDHILFQDMDWIFVCAARSNPSKRPAMELKLAMPIAEYLPFTPESIQQANAAGYSNEEIEEFKQLLADLPANSEWNEDNLSAYADYDEVEYL